jgi:hypothetical protein
LPALIKSGLLLVLRCFERLKIPVFSTSLMRAETAGMLHRATDFL